MFGDPVRLGRFGDRELVTPLVLLFYSFPHRYGDCM